MNTHRLTFGLATVAITTTLSLLPFAGCSNSSNPSPITTLDSSADSPTADSGGSSKDTGLSDSLVGVDSAPEGGREASADAVSFDTGGCVSDSSACNTCYDDAQAAANPYNACSAYTRNCVPVALTVPTHPTL
jgi:hypothetical protein